jgi:hypothetical protein
MNIFIINNCKILKNLHISIPVRCFESRKHGNCSKEKDNLLYVDVCVCVCVCVSMHDRISECICIYLSSQGTQPAPFHMLLIISWPSGDKDSTVLRPLFSRKNLKFFVFFNKIVIIY